MFVISVTLVLPLTVFAYTVCNLYQLDVILQEYLNLSLFQFSFAEICLLHVSAAKCIFKYLC